MNFNDEELSLAALAPHYHFTKEGVLFTHLLRKSQKKTKAIKVHGGFVERWFCLRANLLFCMKGINRTSDVGGVIVLERCSIELDSEESENLFSFVIGQSGSKDLIYLGCKTEAERDQWMSALHTASYECMKMQLDSLREQITLKTGRDPLIAPHSNNLVNSVLVSEDEAPYIEMCLSCSQLRCNNDGVSNCMLDILSLIPPSTDWRLIGQTETVEQSNNPLFMKTIGLGDQHTPTKTRIKIVVYDVRELVSRTRTLIGQATFILEELLASKKLTLDIISPDRSQVGSVNVMSWSTATPTDSSTYASARLQNDLTSAWHADLRTKKKEQLKFLFCNTVCKMFRFPTINQQQLSACEMMAESRLTFTLPLNILKFLLQENNQLKDSVNRLDSVETAHDREKGEISELLTEFSDYLSMSISYLEAKHSRQTFKASQQKGEKTLEVVPINLHIHRLLARNEHTQTGASYDMLTVGAFAIHSRGFKQGGLSRLFKCSSDSHSTLVQRLSHLLKASEELLSIRNSILGACEDIHSACLASDKDSLQSASSHLQQKSSQLMDFCTKQPLFVQSLLTFHSSLKPSNNDNQLNRPATKYEQQSPKSPRLKRITSPHPNQSNHSASRSNQSERKSPPRIVHGQDAWDGALASMLQVTDDIMSAIQRCTDAVEPVHWTDSISSYNMKCEAFLEKLYSIASLALTHSTILHYKEDPFATSLPLMIRFTAIRCQALTAAVSGILAKVRFYIRDEHFLDQLSQIGCLLYFESLLSCHGSELGMLEDFIVGVQWLADVEFRFCESTSANDDYMDNPPIITGSRLHLCVTMSMPSATFQLLPERLRNGQPFNVVPVLFNVGFNEIATLAERVGNTMVQDKVNRSGYATLMDYYSKYESNYGSVSSTLSCRYSVAELLIKLDQNVSDNKKKNMEILYLATEICRKLNCVHFVSCKSAKDRTAMAVTLNECRILQQHHQLSPHIFEKALSCLRSEGVRRQNTFKNIGVMSYTFSSFQILSFPKLYKPPTGTYGKGES